MVAPPPVMTPMVMTGSVTQTANKGTTGKGAYFGGRGQTSGGKGQIIGGREQARVFVLNPQDAQMSNAVVTGNLNVCFKQATVLFDLGATHAFVRLCIKLKFSSVSSMPRH